MPRVVPVSVAAQYRMQVSTSLYNSCIPESGHITQNPYSFGFTAFNFCWNRSNLIPFILTLWIPFFDIINFWSSLKELCYINSYERTLIWNLHKAGERCIIILKDIRHSIQLLKYLEFYISSSLFTSLFLVYKTDIIWLVVK
jgi:hypothetical protein